jgi:hypothetical protein
MAKKTGNTLVFEDLVQASQPDVPDYATRVQNPLGTVVQAAAGTMIGVAGGPLMSTTGGDGQNYNWGLDATGPQWSNNPMPKPPSPFDTVQPFDGRGMRRNGKR